MSELEFTALGVIIGIIITVFALNLLPITKKERLEHAVVVCTFEGGQVIDEILIDGAVGNVNTFGYSVDDIMCTYESCKIDRNKLMGFSADNCKILPSGVTREVYIE